MGLALYSAKATTEEEGMSYTLLARMGKLLRDVESAFLCEGAALEWSLQYLVQPFKGMVTVTKSW